MKSEKPLEIEVQVKGMLPDKLALDAAAILEKFERVEVVPGKKGILLRVVWEADAEFALDRLTEGLKVKLQLSEPHVIYYYEDRWFEPRMAVSVTTPEDFMGDVMGDLSQRRGQVQGMEDEDGGKCIKAIVPLAELIGYKSDLAVLTHGHGSANVEYFDYQPIPTGHGPGPKEPASAALEKTRSESA